MTDLKMNPPVEAPLAFEKSKGQQLRSGRKFLPEEHHRPFCYFSTVHYCPLRVGQSNRSSGVAILSEPATYSLAFSETGKNRTTHLRIPQ